MYSGVKGLFNRSQKVKGTVVLMRKNVLDINSITSVRGLIGTGINIIGSTIDGLTSFLGRSVCLQLISATKADGNGNGVVGKKTYLEGIITSIPTLGAGQSAFTIHFEWDADMGIPGAFLIKNYMQVELFLVSLTLEDIPNQGSMHFVCNSWVYNSKVYEKDRIFFASETYVPSETPGPLVTYREAELQALRGNGTGKRKEWDRVYDYDVYNDLGNPDSGENFARPVLGGSLTHPYPRRGRTGRKPTKKVSKSAWMTDEEFAREMIAGVNPCVIRRLQEFPPQSKLDPSVYGDQTSKMTIDHLEINLEGLTVDKAIKDQRLFILDHHDTFMPFLRRIDESKSSKAYATRTILFLKDDGTLKPLAIELSLPHPGQQQLGAYSKVILPANQGVESTIWLLAKAHVIVNDSCYHQLISHWLNTHAVIEPFVIATNRNLKKTFLGGKYAVEISSSGYKNWVFLDQALPADLIKRGMAIEDSSCPNGLRLVIEDYPYAVDGLEIWDAIKTWVQEYVSLYYATNDAIKKDHELQAWWKEVVEKGHGDLKDKPWWPKMQTLQELIQSCSTIIWIASALHAAVNFGQYPYGGFILNRPTLSRRWIPEEGTPEYDEMTKNPQKAYLRTITPKFQALVDLSVIEILSRHASDEVYLGQRDNPNWTSNPKAIEAFKKFGKKLAEIETKISERNHDPNLRNRTGPAQLPYTVLLPTSETGLTFRGIPNSISI
ncbi:Seed linoleate 9S-lipoxygenase-2 isoform D [Glycine soja]|uniref:Seed linoleate 9S-lipoxygenase-2 isoform D n=1 Tax=Glycine soja TaxID=3848 RepID=A0A445JGU6_GLYSO|nr:Seed linoleate 9S-lipoxygenase-2 isoform D [Glycine soja]